MKLLITRHPITKAIESGIIQGKEHSQITEIGYKQIEKLIQRLKKENITRIISSDAVRAKLMSNKILEHLNVPIEYTGLIDEKNYGEFSGKHKEKVNWNLIIGDTFENQYIPKGENLIMVRERGRKFFREFIEKYQKTNETILMVSHAIFLQIFIGNLLGMDIKNSQLKLLIDYCSLTEIDFNIKYELGLKLEFLNEKNFLGDLV